MLSFGGGVGQGLSPSSLRVPFSSASPSSSNNTTMGRPPMWTASSQRKVSRLYLYTTLPLKKIIDVVYAKSPESAPGTASANKTISMVFDKEPRWLHPRRESDMSRRYAELNRSPTRSNSSRSSGSPNPNSATGRQSAFVFPPHPPPPEFKIETEAETDPISLDFIPTTANTNTATATTTTGTATTATASDSFAPLPQQFAPAYSVHAQLGNGPGPGIVRQMTFLSSSTDHTTGTTHRLLEGFSDEYVGRVKRLMKRFTVGPGASDMSPVSDQGFFPPSWAADEDAPPRLPRGPYHLPGDFLRIEEHMRESLPCFSESEDHIKRACWCFVSETAMRSPWVTSESLTADGRRLLNQTLVASDANKHDLFGNTILHFLAARGCLPLIHRALRHEEFRRHINARNTAGQTFLHVLDRGLFAQEQQVSALIRCATDKGFDLTARDNYGRTIFHLLVSEDVSQVTVNRLLTQFHMASRMQRDAFNVTPAVHTAPVMGIRRADTQLMDLDAGPSRTFLAPVSESANLDASAVEGTQLLWFIGFSHENPQHEHSEGRNGLHCLAAAPLSASTLKKNSLGTDRPRGSKEPKVKDLDSCKNRLEFRHQLAASLLEAGVDANHYDSNGNTPLMAFVAKLPEDDDYVVGPNILNLLIEHGADVNARNRAGETALHIAVRCGRKLAMRALVEAGANVHVRDAAGRSLLEVADVKIRRGGGENVQEYAHVEACRAWLSGQARAVQAPTVSQEWGPTQAYVTRRGPSQETS